MYKKIIISILISILYCPFIFLIFGIKDFPLHGFTEKPSFPDFGTRVWLNGSFQEEMNSYINSNLLSRSIWIRNCNTIRYYLFNLGPSKESGIICKDNDIIDINYIKLELCIGEDKKFKLKQNQDKMKNYVSLMQSVNDKLKNKCKLFYFCVFPGKTHKAFNYNSIPDKYIKYADYDINALEYLKKVLVSANFNYKIYENIDFDINYPKYYKTGIHYSRPYEQTLTREFVKDISAITGKKYRNISLGDIAESKTPYYRDTDVYNLLNLWTKPSHTYYEFNSKQESMEYYDKLNACLIGDSYLEGLYVTYVDLYPNDLIFNIYNNCEMRFKKVPINLFNKDWSKVDFQNLLDETDIIIFGITECHIIYYGFEFFEALDKFLDTYEPSKIFKNYMPYLSADNHTIWQYDYLYGVYNKENGYAFLKDYSEIFLRDPEIFKKGLELNINIPDMLFRENSDDVNIIVYINGYKMLSEDFSSPQDVKRIIKAEKLSHLNSDFLDIEIFCNKSFNPKEFGSSEDNRDLSIKLKYIGRVR